MGLIGNITILHRLPGIRVGGPLASDIRSVPNWHVFEGADQLAAVPSGYNQGGAWVLPQVAGGVSVFRGVAGSSAITLASAAAGVNVSAVMTGVGDVVFASGSLIVGAVAFIAATCNVSAAVAGKLEAAATLAASGNVTGALGALAGAVATITGNSATTATPYATAEASSLIRSYGDLSPEGLAAAVWNAVAASYNAAGSMGAKMNAAASAGDPWSALLPGSYADGEAGKILAQIQTLVDELHKIQGLDAANPMLVTKTARTAGDIALELTGDGVNNTTVTRV